MDGIAAMARRAQKSPPERAGGQGQRFLPAPGMPRLLRRFLCDSWIDLNSRWRRRKKIQGTLAHFARLSDEMPRIPFAAVASAQPRQLFRNWPSWFIFAPVAVYAIGRGIRHGDLSLPFVANPLPGRDGEALSASKSAVLGSLTPEARASVAPFVVLCRREVSATIADALRLIEEGGLGFPLVAKPDRGTGGKGVRLLSGVKELEAYVGSFPPNRRFLLQELVEMPNEAGIMYVRQPSEQIGQVVALALKDPATATGDGFSTLRTLIERHPHARHLRREATAEHAAHLGRIPAAGERVELVFARNRSAGATCIEANHLVTPALSRAIDQIARSIPGFHIGRLDVRFDTLERLATGRGFRILEINCGISEPLQAWDPENGLTDIWRAYFKQIRMIYEIGAANRTIGHIPPGTFAFLRCLWRQIRQMTPSSSTRLRDEGA